jgi:flagellar biosynthetic protein FliP
MRRHFAGIARLTREKRGLFFTARLIYTLTSSRALLILLGLGTLSGLVTGLGAQAVNTPAPSPEMVVPQITVGVNRANSPQEISASLQVLFLLTILTLAPSILIMTTAFTRIIIVLAIMRSAMGIPQVPPNQVMIGLALFLTFFVMRPTFTRINNDALQPYFNNKITFQEAIDRSIQPLRSFMVRQTYKKDLQFFISIARLEKPPANIDEVPLTVLVPAFITSELKTGFIMGFYIYLPFLIIDIVVASTLMSMGMMMLPPTVVSLPAKILLFVLADGWLLLLGSLAKGFH